MKTLSDKDINTKLEALPEWDFIDNALYCEIEFDNFKDCFSAMSRMAFECEAQNHHPEWSNTYNLLTISLTTHDANGVTQKDFDLAHAIEAIVEEE